MKIKCLGKKEHPSAKKLPTEKETLPGSFLVELGLRYDHITWSVNSGAA